VPCHHLLSQALGRFEHEREGYLFPSPFIVDKPITTASVDRWFRAALEKAGLRGRGYSLHSFRRTCLTVLRKKGCSVRLIQQFSGHKSLDSLQNYLDCGTGELVDVVEMLE
jgi:integrase/recombinase XerD